MNHSWHNAWERSHACPRQSYPTTEFLVNPEPPSRSELAADRNVGQEQPRAVLSRFTPDKQAEISPGCGLGGDRFGHGRALALQVAK